MGRGRAAPDEDNLGERVERRCNGDMAGNGKGTISKMVGVTSKVCSISVTQDWEMMLCLG